MAEPIPPIPEQPKPQQLIVGETKIFLKTPQMIHDQDVSELTIQSADKRGIEGASSSVLLTREASRKKGSEGQIVDKPMMNLNDFDEVSWDKVSGIQYQDTAGNPQTIAKENLSLEKPTFAEATVGMPVEPQPEIPPTLPTPERARAILETIKEDPNIITIVGLKAYETRAKDLAERHMQTLSTPRAQERADATRNVFEKTKDSITSINDFVGNVMWKQSMGGFYFQEKARQYYMDMLTAANTPFAESSIRLAEARAKLTYDKMLADKNFIARAGSKAIEWFKDGIGARTTIQNLALQEISIMKENGELSGMDTFDREAKAIRLRFSQDIDNANTFVRKNLGEKLEILDPENAEHKPLVEGVQSLIKRYATGEIVDKAAFDAESKTFFQTTLKDAKPEIFAEAELYSSSMFDAAEVVRAKASHESGLATLDADIANMKIRLGLGQMGEITSIQPDLVLQSVSKIDAMITWINKKNIIMHPIVANEATIASAVAIALSFTNFAKTMPARMVAPLIGGSIAGGAFAGIREYSNLKRDYLTHVREREVGTSFGDQLKRRNWFEKYMVKQRSADDLIGTLQSTLYDADGTLKSTLTVDELRTGMATLADIAARKTLSETGLTRKPMDNDIRRIGLIQFSGRENIETQRTALDVISNKALSDLSTQGNLPEEVLGGNTFEDFMIKLTSDQTRILKEGVQTLDALDDPTKNILGLVTSYAPEAEIVKRRWPLAGAASDENTKALGIDAIYEEFKKEARMEAIKYGIKSGIIGAAVGAVMHETFALIGNTHPIDSVTHAVEPRHLAPETPSGLHETVAFTTPDPANTVHIGTHDYQLPKELSITSKLVEVGGKGHEETFTQYDAVVHVPGKPDIILSEHANQKDLIDTLSNKLKFTITDEKFTKPIESIRTSIDELVTKEHVALTAQLPPGYHLDHITQPGHANGWSLIDDKHNLVAHGIHFNADGSIANAGEVTKQLSEHGMSLNSHEIPYHPLAPEAPPGTETLPNVIPIPSSEKMIIDGDKLPKGGIWDYFLGQARGENGVSAANGMKNLFRLHEHQFGTDNIKFGADGANPYDHTLHLREAYLGTEHGKIDIDLARIPNDAHIELPKDVFGSEAVQKFGTLNDSAIKHYQDLIAHGDTPMHAINTLYNSTDPKDHLDGIMLKLGYLGDDRQLPTKPEDLQFLYDKLGAHVVTETGKTAAGTVTGEVAPIPSTIHEAIFTKSPDVATPGTITANTINVPYFTATEQAQVQEIVANHGILPVEAGLGHTQTLIDKLPWIPIFLPYRQSLESAYIEPVVINTELINPKQETMLSPFGIENALLTREQLDNRKSPRLAENPEANLSQSEEISWYLSTLSEPEKALNAELSIQYAKPMSETTRATVILPIPNDPAAVSQLLSQYATQTNIDGTSFDPKQYEVVIYNALMGENPSDQVKSVVDTFVADHPDHQVSYLSHTYTEPVQFGKIKRDVTNCVLERIADKQDVTIVNSPDQIDAIPTTYLSNILEQMNEPTIDMIVGKYTFSNEAYTALPMILAPYRAYELMDALTRHTHGNHLPSAISGNSAVRSSVLAAVGGYNPEVKAAEDRELAWMVQTARNKTDTIATHPDTITFDPKVYLSRKLQQLGIAEETYKDLSWQEMGEKVKEVYTKEMLEKELTDTYNGMYPELKAKDAEGFNKNFGFVLDSMGLAHEIRDGNVTILDESKLASAITSIPDTESFARITAESFAEADRTAREVLSGIAKTEETPVQPEISTNSEPLASFVSSPEISDVAPTPETPTPPVPETLPEGINDRIDYVLQKNNETTSAIVPIKPAELMDYLKTSLDIAGTRVTDGNLTYSDGKLHMQNLKAKGFGGEYEFSADMMSDPQKGLIVDPNTLQMKLPLIARPWSGTARKLALNLNESMLNHLDARINPIWKASRIDLVGEKLEISFNKKV